MDKLKSFRNKKKINKLVISAKKRLISKLDKEIQALIDDKVFMDQLEQELIDNRKSIDKYITNAFIISKKETTY